MLRRQGYVQGYVDFSIDSLVPSPIGKKQLGFF